MQLNKITEAIEAGRIIAILRGDFEGREEDIVSVLVQAGITAVEVTLNSPRALNSIKLLAMRFGSQIAIGAGTVLKPEEVESVADAGGQFIVSPNRDIHVIQATRRRGMASFPGCFTPSEVVEALQAGADAAKLFPAQCLGVNFVKAMRGPLSHARLIPTGGVTPQAARDYLEAGAWAVGVGSELVSTKVLTTGGAEDLCQRALAYVAAVRSRREAGANV